MYLLKASDGPGCTQKEFNMQRTFITTLAAGASASVPPPGNRKPSANRYGTCQPPRNSDVHMPAMTVVSTMSVIRNMPNFMPLYSTL